MIGVVNYHTQKDRQCSYNSGNAVAYYGYNGSIFPTAVKEGAGFFGGETVEVSVDLAKKTIKWSVGGTPRAS